MRQKSWRKLQHTPEEAQEQHSRGRGTEQERRSVNISFTLRLLRPVCALVLTEYMGLAGFNAVDVLAWGAIGHAIGYLVLATTSLNSAGFNPKPF